MRPFCVFILLVFAFQGAQATTCVSQQKFKTQAAGVVVDPAGVPLADARVQITSLSNPELIESVMTKKDGKFHFPQIPKGEYKLEVRLEWFLPARQEIIITKVSEKMPSKPMTVILDIAGGCSWVRKR